MHMGEFVAKVLITFGSNKMHHDKWRDVQLHRLVSAMTTVSNVLLSGNVAVDEPAKHQ